MKTTIILMAVLFVFAAAVYAQQACVEVQQGADRSSCNGMRDVVDRYTRNTYCCERSLYPIVEHSRVRVTCSCLTAYQPGPGINLPDTRHEDREADGLTRQRQRLQPTPGRGKHGKKTATTTAATTSTASAWAASRVWRKRKKKRRKNKEFSSTVTSLTSIQVVEQKEGRNQLFLFSLNGESGKDNPESFQKSDKHFSDTNFQEPSGNSQNKGHTFGSLGLLLLTLDTLSTLFLSLCHQLTLLGCATRQNSSSFFKQTQRVSRTCATNSRHLGSSRMVIWPALILASGLVHLQLASAQTLTTSSKPSGPLCGSATPATQCVLSATCSLTGDCECPAGYYGDGDYHCFPDARSRTQVTGPGNKLLTLANTSADLLWPCRTRFTEVKTTRTSDGNTCHFQIFLLSKIIGGRVAPGGMEVHFQVEGDSTIPNGIGIRKEGIVDHGVFTFAEWGRDAFQLETPVTESDPNFSPDTMYTDTDGSGSGDSMTFIDDGEDDSDDWGAPEQLGIGSGQVVAAKLDDDNFAVVDVPDCGVDIRFRPSNVQASQQTQTSGVSVSVDERNTPAFPDVDTYLSESTSSNSLATQATQNGQSSTLEALHRAMMNDAKQPSSSLGEECAKTSFTYRSSCSSHSDRLQALASCSFFFSNNNLVGCMDTDTDGTGHRSLNAFRLCLMSICSQNSKFCLLLKTRVEDRGCMEHTPDSFKDMPCTA